MQPFTADIGVVAVPVVNEGILIGKGSDLNLN